MVVQEAWVAQKTLNSFTPSGTHLRQLILSFVIA
jgi:hypothetical protein